MFENHVIDALDEAQGRRLKPEQIVTINDIPYKKVSAAVFYDFCNRFYKQAKYKNLRFGQAFINEFYPNCANEITGNIFYAETIEETTTFIIENFIYIPEQQELADPSTFEKISSKPRNNNGHSFYFSNNKRRR